MSPFKDLLKRRKITQKITIIVFIFTFFPTMLFFTFLIANMKKSAINDQIGIIRTSMNQDYSQLQKYIELCNMSTQVFLNNPNLIDYLERVKSGESIEIEESMNFYRNDIASMERLVNSNPYLYQIRVYVDSDNLREMMPILYKKDRMKRLSWGNGIITSGTWHYDYSDTIFPKHVMGYVEHIMSLTTQIPSYTYGSLGIIEVAIHMDNVFPDLFKTSTSTWSCFIDSREKLLYDRSAKNRFSPFVNEILEKVKSKAKIEQPLMKESYFITTIDSEEVIIATKPISELNATLIKVVSLKNTNNEIIHFRNLYLILLFITLAILIIVIEVVVKKGSKRFYIVFDTLHKVQKGNLDVVVTDCGSDEIGELADQVNLMLKKIKQLIKDNIDREILVKNSEIRALQNQINAHFIYNVLESVKMMAEIEEQYDISDAVTSLGKMLRYSMKGLSKNVTLRQEIEYIKDYINLMNLRFDYEIYLSLRIPEVLWEEEIPKMSLQPIIENAISHGIEDIAEDTNIYVKGIVCESYFSIEVTDQGKGIPAEQLEQLRRKIDGDIETEGGTGRGIGLKNVQDRIKIHFGEDYGINISSMEGCYTKVSITIPRNLESKELESR